MDNDDISYHKELDSLMDELHSLGSTRTWHIGDSTKMIRNWIEQQKKTNSIEDEKRKPWREIFDYYRENGQMVTLERYNKVENILGMTYIFEKYFKVERWITSAKNRIEVFERNKAYYRSLYSEIMENGYHSMCEKFGYTGTLGNLRKRFKKYIDEYKKDDF